MRFTYAIKTSLTLINLTRVILEKIYSSQRKNFKDVFESLVKILFPLPINIFIFNYNLQKSAGK